MTKAELHSVVTSEVLEVLASAKVAKKHQEAIQAILDNYLKPKSGGGKTMNPPIEVDGITYYFCRWHQCYEPASEMVLSKGKSKGYCKAAISKWNKANAKIKKLDSEATTKLLDGDAEAATKIANEAKELKDIFNSPSYYNYAEDWSAFDKNLNFEDLQAKYKKLKSLQGSE